MNVFQGVYRSLLLALVLGWGAQVAWAAGAVDVHQASALQGKGALLVDVRTPGEFAEVRAPGAVLIPLDQVSKRLAEFGAKDRPIALICRSGNRSGQAQGILEQTGFTKTVNVTGGMNAWERSGLPVVKGP